MVEPLTAMRSRLGDELTPPKSRAHRARSVYLEAVVQPLEPEVDHVRGDPDQRVILEYGEDECPLLPVGAG